MSGGMSAHEVLGIAPRASAKEIRRAYKRLARKYHPDRNPSAEAVEKFKAVKAAHDSMLAALEAGAPPPPKPDQSPGFSQTRSSASRRTGSGASRNWRTTDPGPRWRDTGWTKTGAGRARTTSRRAPRRPEPKVTYRDAVDPEELMYEFEPRDIYRSSIWMIAIFTWFVMFFGFVLGLRSMGRPTTAPEVEPTEERPETPDTPRPSRRRPGVR